MRLSDLAPKVIYGIGKYVLYLFVALVAFGIFAGITEKAPKGDPLIEWLTQNSEVFGWAAIIIGCYFARLLYKRTEYVQYYKDKLAKADEDGNRIKGMSREGETSDWYESNRAEAQKFKDAITKFTSWEWRITRGLLAAVLIVYGVTKIAQEELYSRTWADIAYRAFWLLIGCRS
jgi:hypothetical protein